MPDRTAKPSATRSCRRCAPTRTSSSWARTSPRWAARWASRRGCSRSSAPSASATRRSPRWRSSGAAIGAAMQGMRPVVEIMYEDFLTLSLEQIVNQAAKHRYMSGGQLKVPLTSARRAAPAGRRAPSTRSSSRRGSCTCRASRSCYASTPERRARPALVVDLRRQPRRSSSSTGCSTRSRERCPRSSSRSRSARRASYREGTDVTVIATGPLVHRVARGGRGGRGRGDLGRGRRPAHAPAARRGDARRVGEEDEPRRRRARGRDADGLRRRGGGRAPVEGVRLARRADRARRREVRAARRSRRRWRSSSSRSRRTCSPRSRGRWRRG